MELKYPWMVIAKTNQGKVVSENCSYDERSKRQAFYECWFSGLKGLYDFFPVPIRFYIKEGNGKLIVEEDVPLFGGRDLEIFSLEESDKLMVKLANETAEKFRKGVKEKTGIDLNIYGWIGKPKASELIDYCF